MQPGKAGWPTKRSVRIFFRAILHCDSDPITKHSPDQLSQPLLA
jgi:hypothetical protein